MKSGLFALALAASVTAGSCVLAVAGTAGNEPADPAVDEAYDIGMRAYGEGDLSLARERLQYASDHGHFLAIYYLARMYGNEDSGLADPAKAYGLYKDLADAYQDLNNPQADYRSPFVARAHVKVAQVLRTGLPSARVAVDLERAQQYLEYAANYFDDANAQFELAKAYLSGEFGDDRVRQGMDWLAVLAEKKAHAGAQAQLAELYWTGKHVDQSPTLALALAMLAAENATDEDRLWVDDAYQRAFCGSTVAQRKRALQLVASWRRKPSLWAITKEIEKVGDDELPLLGEKPLTRSCGDGETLLPLRHDGSSLADDQDAEHVEATVSTEENFELGVIEDDTGVAALPLDDMPAILSKQTDSADGVAGRSGPIFGSTETPLGGALGLGLNE